MLIQSIAQLRTRGLCPTLILTDTQRIADSNRELDTYREEIHGLVKSLQLTDQVEFVSVAYCSTPTPTCPASMTAPTCGPEVSARMRTALAIGPTNGSAALT